MPPHRKMLLLMKTIQKVTTYVCFRLFSSMLAIMLLASRTTIRISLPIIILSRIYLTLHTRIHRDQTNDFLYNLIFALLLATVLPTNLVQRLAMLQIGCSPLILDILARIQKPLEKCIILSPTKKLQSRKLLTEHASFGKLPVEEQHQVVNRKNLVPLLHNEQ